MSTTFRADSSEDEANEIDRIQSVIREFLRRSDEKLFETRIQKLIFFTEVYCVLHYRRRMTHAEYRPYMYGAFSRDVREALEKLEDVNRSREIVHGSRTTSYRIEEDEVDLDDASKKVIERIHAATKSTDTEDLAQFSKKSWLFEETEYNHPMDFEEFRAALDDHKEIEEDLEERMPEKVEDIDVSELLPLNP